MRIPAPREVDLLSTESRRTARSAAPDPRLSAFLRSIGLGRLPLAPNLQELINHTRELD